MLALEPQENLAMSALLPEVLTALVATLLCKARQSQLRLRLHEPVPQQSAAHCVWRRAQVRQVVALLH